MNNLILIFFYKGTSGYQVKGRQRILSFVWHVKMLLNQINNIPMVPILEQSRFLPVWDLGLNITISYFKHSHLYFS